MGTTFRPRRGRGRVGVILLALVTMTGGMVLSSEATASTYGPDAAVTDEATDLATPASGESPDPRLDPLPGLDPSPDPSPSTPAYATRIHGCVTDPVTQSVLAGATVTVLQALTGSVLATTTTDVTGAYAVDGVQPTQVKVRAELAGRQTTYAYGAATFAEAAVLTLLSGDDVVVSLSLAPLPAAVEGQVLSWMDPLGGATVEVLDAGTGAVLASVTLGELEYEYRIDGLPAVQVRVRGSKSGYVTTFATGVTGDVFQLLPGQTLQQTWDPLDLYLDLAPAPVVTTGAITGSVRAISQDPADPYDGPAVAAIVTAYDAATGVAVRSTRTDALGEFRLDPLPAGDYKVRAALAGHLTTFALGRRTLATADVFSVAAGRTVALPGELVLWAEAVLEGQVLGWMDPLGGATVSVLDAVTGKVLRSVKLAEGQDEYRIGGLAAGQVKVRATKPGWIMDFANDRDTFAQADVFTLVPGVTLAPTWSPQPNLYLDLTPEAAISGLVMGFSEYMDDPLAGATVVALDATTGRTLGRATTDAAGEFRIGGLAAGQVKVRVSATGFLTTYLDGRSSFSTADVYTVTPQQTLEVPGTGAIALFGEAAVEGQVLSHMDPVGGATVAVLDAATGRVLRSVRLAEDQDEYRIGGLAAGDVKVRATKPGYLPDFANNRDTFAEGDVFTLRSGVTLRQTWTPEADLYLDLEPESVIEGSVLGIDDAPATAWDGPLAGATVTAYDATSGAAVRSVRTDALGAFRLDRLPAGEYKVRAASAGYLTTFAYGRSTRATADVLTVGSGQTLTLAQEIVLYAAATIHGYIMGFRGGDDPWDDGLPDVRVAAIDVTTGRVVASTSSGRDPYGVYRLDGLSAGTYRLRASKDGWLTSYAGPVTGVAGEVVGRHMWPLYGEAVVEGQVLGGFDPLGGATVTVYDAVTGVPLRFVRADGDGYYRVAGLGDPYSDSASDVKVRAAKTGWYPSFANGRTSLATADVFTLRHGEVLRQSWDPPVLYLDLVPRPPSSGTSWTETYQRAVGWP